MDFGFLCHWVSNWGLVIVICHLDLRSSPGLAARRQQTQTTLQHLSAWLSAKIVILVVIPNLNNLNVTV